MSKACSKNFFSSFENEFLDDRLLQDEYRFFEVPYGAVFNQLRYLLKTGKDRGHP